MHLHQPVIAIMGLMMERDVECHDVSTTGDIDDIDR